MSAYEKRGGQEAERLYRASDAARRAAVAAGPARTDAPNKREPGPWQDRSRGPRSIQRPS